MIVTLSITIPILSLLSPSHIHIGYCTWYSIVITYDLFPAPIEVSLERVDCTPLVELLDDLLVDSNRFGDDPVLHTRLPLVLVTVDDLPEQEKGIVSFKVLIFYYTCT